MFQIRESQGLGHPNLPVCPGLRSKCIAFLIYFCSPLNNDSVENSFREKLSVQEKRNQKDLKELAVFEMLEDAANDSSFCSTSSRVKTLMNHSILPSPQVPPVNYPSLILLHSCNFRGGRVSQVPLQLQTKAVQVR